LHRRLRRLPLLALLSKRSEGTSRVAVPIARKTEEPCPRCENEDHVWVFEKVEGTATKDCYTCESCGCEWSEV
jgi:DNA-directed RNA polymerase subunit M/transcription elongation factor TFIIS